MSRRKPDNLNEVDEAVQRGHIQRQQERDRLRRRWEALSVGLIGELGKDANGPAAYWVLGINRAIFGLFRVRTIPSGHGHAWSEGMSDYYQKQIENWIEGVPAQAAHLVPKIREFLKTI